MLMQVHDSLVCSCPPDEAYDVAAYMRDQIEEELDYGGVELSVPMEVSIGVNWGDKIEIGVLPAREVFERKMREVMR